MLKTKLHARDNHAYEQPPAPVRVILYIKAYDTDQYRYTLLILTTNIIMKAKPNALWLLHIIYTGSELLH